MSLYLFSSGIGGFLGGPLADRVGARRVIMWSLVASVPFMAAAPHLPPLGFTAMLAVGGLLLQSTLPISVTFAQSFVKGGAATVSSLMMGFAWGMGSLPCRSSAWAPIASASSATLAVVAFIPLLAAVLAWRLPERRRAHVEPRSIPCLKPVAVASPRVDYDLTRGALPSPASVIVRPGRLTPAVKILIITNVVVFVLNLIVGDAMTLRLGLSPQAVFEQFALWQPFTYMFLHSTAALAICCSTCWRCGCSAPSSSARGARASSEVLLRHRRRRGGDEPAAVDVLRRASTTR